MADPDVVDNSLPKRRLYFVNKTGYMTQDIWEEALLVLAEERQKVQAHMLKGILLMDGLAVHHSDEAKEIIGLAGLVPLVLPPNTTHWSQPLDDKIFGTLKGYLRSHAIQLDATLSRHIDYLHFRQNSLSADEVAHWRRVRSDAVLLALRGAEKSAFTQHRIKLSYRNTCIWPWSEEKFKKLARKNLLVSEDVCSAFLSCIFNCLTSPVAR